MPRIFRLLPEQGVLHVLTRGNNRQRVFHGREDFERYLYYLKLYKEEHKFRLYHYCLMPNHVHLLIETSQQTHLSKLMKQLNLAYFYHYRKKYKHWGHLWQGRYISLIIDRDEYLIRCGRYIEKNPVRARIVDRLEDYPWTSYRYYAIGEEQGLIDQDPVYENLGNDSGERRRNYREVSEEEIDLRKRYLGSEGFIKEMEERFGIKNLENKRGRPKKENK